MGRQTRQALVLEPKCPGCMTGAESGSRSQMAATHRHSETACARHNSNPDRQLARRAFPPYQRQSATVSRSIVTRWMSSGAVFNS